jgi:O-antigen/teichoic acid export membrane protein
VITADEMRHPRLHSWLAGRIRAAHKTGVLAVALGNAGVLVLGLIASIVAARALGPAGRGEFFGSSSVAMVVSMALGLGSVQAIVTFRGRGIPRSVLVSQVVGATLICAVVMTALKLFTVHPWLDGWGILGCALWCAASLLSSFSASFAQRRADMIRGYQSVRLAPQGASVVCMIGLALLTAGGSNRWLLLSGASMALVAAVQFHRFGRAAALPDAEDGAASDARAFAREASSTTPAMLATLAFNRMDIALVAVLFAPEKIAMYAIAVAALGACTALGNAVGMVTFSRLSVDGFDEHSGRYVLVSVARAVAGAALPAAAVAILAPRLVELFYGGDFLEAVGGTRWLALGAIPSAAAYLLFHVMLLLGQRRAVTLTYVVGSLLIAGGVIAASVHADLEFAALTVTCSYALLACFLWFWVRKGLKATQSSTPAAVSVPAAET